MDKSVEYFRKILAIPRPSGKEEKVADFLCDFASRNHFECYRDTHNNVIIKKNNNSRKTIILQGHIDMVCIAEKGVYKNFDAEGIDWVLEGDYIHAQKTSLGADNGVGVAVILSLLEENNARFPNIEAVFTVQEETTMLGANTVNYSKLSGNTLLSLDGDREGVIEVSSAGFCSVKINKKLKKINPKEKLNIFSIEISGLTGGHSGDDIDKGRLSANKLLGLMLKEIEPQGIISIYGGEKSNSIPVMAICDFVTTKTVGEISSICSKYRKLEEENKNHPNIVFTKIEDGNWNIYDESNISAFLSEFGQGVLFANGDGFPIVSQNLGMVRFKNGEVEFTISLRSSDKHLEKLCLEKLKEFSKGYKFDYVLEYSNPFFSYNKNSVLRPKLIKAYKSLYGIPARERNIHAGLEGGVFAKNISDIDICVIGADIYDMHSTKERVRVSSIHRVYGWVFKTLKDFAR